MEVVIRIFPLSSIVFPLSYMLNTFLNLCGIYLISFSQPKNMTCFIFYSVHFI